MRLYTFCNCYLSSIQQGIQTAHILGELHNMATANCITVASDTKIGSVTQEVLYDKAALMIKDWSEQHKTIIVCNGGNAAMIRELITFFDTPENPFPWATFNEDNDSLDGALTGVGIILPEEIYDAKFSPAPSEGTGVYRPAFYFDESGKIYEEGTYLFDLIKNVKSKRLAI